MTCDPQQFLHLHEEFKKKKKNQLTHMSYEPAKKTRQAEPHLSGDADNNSWHMKPDLLIQPICKTRAIHSDATQQARTSRKSMPASQGLRKAQNAYWSVWWRLSWLLAFVFLLLSVPVWWMHLKFPGQVVRWHRNKLPAPRFTGCSTITKLCRAVQNHNGWWTAQRKSLVWYIHRTTQFF